MTELLKCKCGSDKMTVRAVIVDDVQEMRAECNTCGRASVWRTTDDAAGTSWNADRLAEEKAREALRAVIDDHEERARTYGKMETQIHRVAVMQQAAEALRLLEEG